MDNHDFVGLIERVRAGDKEAINCLLRSFEPEVRLMVRKRLPKALRTQFDSMDFVQSVWKSVMTGPGRAAAEFDDLGRFRSFLAGVAGNKVLEEYRRRTRSRKYDLRREEPLYVRRSGGRVEPRELPAADPTPSQEVQAADRLDQLVAGRGPRAAEVVELRRQGLTFGEIAERTGLHERTVRRVIDDLRRRLEGE